jgi:hypothetical protein
MDDSEKTNISAESSTTLTSMDKKRPWSVTTLVLLVLIIAVINLIRFLLSIRDWDFIASRSSVSPLYLALTGLIWTVAGIFLLWGLWRAKPWTPNLMQAVGLTYALYYWLDQIFLKDHQFSETTGAIRAVLPTNWLFAALVTAVFLGWMEWVLSRKKVKIYFGSETTTS